MNRRTCSFWKIFAAVFLSLLPPLMASHVHAQTVTFVHGFSGPDGELPRYGALIQGRDGALYGTTQSGGSANEGVIYKLRATGNGNLTFHDFNGTDGSTVDGGVTLGRDGSYYGVTALGGSANKGTLFKIDASGTYTLLYSFTGGADGIYPVAAPTQAADGIFYGTTSGSSESILPTVYKYSPTLGLSTIYTFTNFTQPENPLLQATDGNLYISTPGGGTQGCGSIVKLTTAGILKSSYSLNCTLPNPTGPIGALIQASDGFLYGTTQGGGPLNAGTIFKLDLKAKALTVLYNFGTVANDGAGAQAGLVQGTDGNFYGTTTIGGTRNLGTIYKITPTGTYTQLYSFSGTSGAQPAFPEASLIQHTNGAFYGTTENGGSLQLGNVFKLDMGLAPFVTFVSSSGRVGQPAQILGQGLTGATSVTFNGVAATSFSVVRDTYMTAVVPTGATTGSVVVATPTGVLTSNVAFHVLK